MAEPAVDPEAELIGSSPALLALRAAIGPAAATDTPLFLAGESGTGKDRVAQLIHAASPRAGASLVTLNGSALPDDILDREIYGNAGPGTPQPYPSVPRYLALAQGGTLYVDDICRTSPVLQARLLHLIRTARIVDEGGIEQPFTARIIAATNTDLGECLSRGRLRRDLYDMLSAGLIEFPPLRARGADAAQIAARVFPELQRRLGLPQVPLSTATLARI
jgi:DNA-binding NtrC family response regulator